MKCEMCSKEVVQVFNPCWECNEVLQKKNYDRGRKKAFQEAIETVFKTPFKGEVSFANFQDNIIKALKEKMDRE